MKAIYKLPLSVCIGITILSIGSCSKKQTPAPTVTHNTPAEVYDSNNHAALYPTTGMATDASGNLYLADRNMVAVITPAGVQTVIAGNTNNKSGYVDDKGSAALFDMPSGLAIDAMRNIYVADAANNVIRKITPDGTTTTIAGNGKAGYVDGPAKTASFNFPQGITIDNKGNIYVADTGNDLIRKIAPDGTVSTVAGKVESGKADGIGTSARFNIPQGITIDNNGNLFVADAGNNLVRKITPDGIVGTFAGSGYATSFDATGKLAAFDFPNATTMGSNGYLYVTDAFSSQVRKISLDAQVTRLENVNDFPAFEIPYLPTVNFLGRPITLISPNGITFNIAKNDLFIADYGNGYIREGSVN